MPHLSLSPRTQGRLQMERGPQSFAPLPSGSLGEEDVAQQSEDRLSELPVCASHCQALSIDFLI